MVNSSAPTRRSILLLVTLFIMAGCGGGSPTAPLPLALPPLLSQPTTTRYNISGTVTGDGVPIANIPLTLYYDGSFRTAATTTDANGRYSFAFQTNQTSFGGNIGVVGVIEHFREAGEFETYVQSIPVGPGDVIRDLHLRRVRTVNAGESIAVSIDSNSSVAYDGEDWLRTNWRWEKLHVRAAKAGTLTITAAGGDPPTIAVFCMYPHDNCLDLAYFDAPAGSAVRRVGGDSLFEIRLAIKSEMLAQKYQVLTSLH